MLLSRSNASAGSSSRRYVRASITTLGMSRRLPERISRSVGATPCAYRHRADVEQFDGQEPAQGGEEFV